MELVKITESEWWEYYAFDDNCENVFIDNLVNMFAKNDRIYDSRTETECDQVGTSTLIITREIKIKTIFCARVFPEDDPITVAKYLDSLHAKAENIINTDVNVKQAIEHVFNEEQI